MILLDDFFKIANFKEWTVCMNNDIKEDVCSLLDANETPERKKKLTDFISWKRNNNKTRNFRSIDTPKCLQFLRLKGFSDRWLFLGAFKQNGFYVDQNGNEIYNLERIPDFEMFSERLVVKYSKSSGDKQAKLSFKRYQRMEVLEILPDIFVKSYKSFPGYDNIRLSFSEMKRIFTTPYTNWKDALTVINGIYVIADKSNGKIYVGSTYGVDGVWQRWNSYVDTNGHGGDVELKALIDSDPNYALDNFQFSLVEYFFNIKKGKNDKIIIERESYWKEALLTRSLGYNCN